MNQRTILIVTTAAVLFGATAVQAWHSPYAFPSRIESAALAADTDKLEQLINYDLIQDSFAESMVNNVEPEVRPRVSGLVHALTETALTPKHTIQLYTQDTLNFGASEAIISANDFDKKSLRRKYVNFSTFEYHIDTKGNSNSHNEYVITAKRRGLFDWQIVAVTFNRVDETIPATSPERTTRFTRTAPDVFLTADRTVSCSVKQNAVECVNENTDALVCNQSICEYDETGDVQYRQGTVFAGEFKVGQITCNVTASNVQCYVRNSTGEITSEYVEAIGDVSGARN